MFGMLCSCPNHKANFFHLDLGPWLHVNLLSTVKWFGGLPWNTIFAFTCWHLWKWRNRLEFLGDADLVSNPRQTICVSAMEWFKSALVGNTGNAKTQLLLAWDPPEVGKFKLNVDGSRKITSGCIGAGGVIRDFHGDWISGFAVNLG